MLPIHNSYTANPPATDHQIVHIENKLNCQLPSAYTLVLKESNGLSFTNGVFIYGTEEIVERNETWEVAEYAKGYIAIGDDSGGMIFLMDIKAEDYRVLAVDSGDMNPEHATLITSDLSKWLQEGCQYE
ncbi:SMI1/KNR4 family protein [Lysinibacillus sp. ACHW1.5]|uniref:SMI1/KNR4 family protein n=1 Tax=Lysinibacillus sp. ACHW1.5 TaxID=2913506 RepID=UPI001EDBFAF1|nr:SMI1/KNR4 family protein [Lysinibacillus sp. ACHW1.5]UKJ43910.1 SMI1/KNR4 family protein [Lysinibacillus sp. ACHW1.5]